MDPMKLCPSCRKPLAPNAPDGLCPACLLQAGADTGFDLCPESQPAGGRTRFEAPTPEEVARLFPQLDILGFLGQGGMGAVYLARQKALERVVALKVLPPGSGQEASFADRFTREAKALARLNHPGIVTLYEFGQADRLFYFLMEFVDGVNLRQLLDAGRLSAREALAIVPQICDALQYSHDQGIVHRDIKPENILLDRQGRVKVADFGLAKIVRGTESLGSPDAETVATGGAGASPVLTEAGKVMGTPQYMAPEQRENPTEVDHRADIYALGVVFYQMLTGELPGKLITVPSQKVQVDVRLDAVVLRALERKPELRFQQVSDVKTMVATIVANPTGDFPPEPAQSASAAPRILKTGSGTITTPARLATLAGQFFHYRNSNGQITLDDRQLTHTRAGRQTIIPLAAIRDLGIGQYPRTVNLAGIQFISVLYEEGGQRKQVLLSPSVFKARITEWQMAIREAILAATGRVPASSPVDRFGTPIQLFVPSLVQAFVLVMFGAALFLKFYSQIQAPAGPSGMDVQPVGVSNNVLIAEVTTEVGRGNAELRIFLEGARLPAKTEAAAADTFFPPFNGTFIKPTPYPGNHSWRILPPGHLTWRVGFVLPDAATAQEAFTHFRLIGKVPAGPGHTFGGTLFRASQTNGQEFVATLQGGPVLASNDPRWVQVSGYSQINESTSVTLTWELLASRPGLAQFSRVGTPIKVLKSDPRTKLWGLSIQLELTKIDRDRVRFVRQIGGTSVGEEFPGNFRELADELLRTATFSVKTEPAMRIELCQLQGESFTVQVGGAEAATPNG